MTTPQFRHKAAYGYTGSGKTTLVKSFIKTYLRHKQQVIIYAGNNDTDFGSGVKFVFDVEELEAALLDDENKGAFIILDEGADIYEDVKPTQHPTVHRLFRKGRHDGFTVWILTQYYTAIPPKVRRNCAERFIFAQGDEESAKTIWQDCGRIEFEGRPLWECVMALENYEYFRYLHPNIITKHKTVKT